MKRALDKAGIRTPRHVAADSIAAVWTAAREIGFPVILKPIAGAGSADTYRVNSNDDLRAVLPALRHVPVVSVEEFVDGEEYTFDTITIDGKIAYYNIAWYRPRPLIARSNEWISPQVIALRDIDRPEFEGAIDMGRRVIEILGFDTGFTHMEWYRKADGEIVFGEIGARPPGAHHVDQMKFACDFDVFKAWARAVTEKRFDEDIQRKYNVATIYKRARGVGRIQSIEGADELQQRFGEHVVWNTLLPPGTGGRRSFPTVSSCCGIRISARRSRWPMPSARNCTSSPAKQPVYQANSARYFGNISRQVSQLWWYPGPQESTRFGTPLSPNTFARRHDSPMSS